MAHINKICCLIEILIALVMYKHQRSKKITNLNKQSNIRCIVYENSRKRGRLTKRSGSKMYPASYLSISRNSLVALFR